jgi:hypothetical protein
MSNSIVEVDTKFVFVAEVDKLFESFFCERVNVVIILEEFL